MKKIFKNTFSFSTIPELTSTKNPTQISLCNFLKLPKHRGQSSRQNLATIRWPWQQWNATSSKSSKWCTCFSGNTPNLENKYDNCDNWRNMTNHEHQYEHITNQISKKRLCDRLNACRFVCHHEWISYKNCVFSTCQQGSKDKILELIP